MRSDSLPPVLVADDQPLMRWAIGRTLEGLGFDPVFAASEDAALAEIERHPFAMAVVSERIEQHDASAVIEALNRRGVFRIILLAEYGAAVAPPQPGQTVVMDKPFSLESVVSAIRTLSAQAP